MKININKPMWVVLLDYAYQVEPDDCFVIGVFDSYEKAKEAFDKAVAENRIIDEDNGFDKFEQDERVYNAWIDGEYNLYHTTITLGDYELNKVYRG